MDPLCGAWSAPDATGACQTRPWTLSAEPIGDPGAREAAVAIDGRGRAVAAWQVAESDRVWLEAAEESAPGVWAVRKPAAALDLDSERPDVVAGADGSAMITWRQGRGNTGAVFVSERDVAGMWADPAGEAEAFSFPPTAYQPRLATNRGGEWLLVWNQWMTSPDYGVAVARKRGAGSGWDRPATQDDVLSPAVFFSNTPVVALNDAGEALISWYQSLGGPLMAFVSERAGVDAPFSHPGPMGFISAPGGAVDSDPVAAVKPAVAPDGSAAVVWTQENGQGATLVYLATRDAGGRWTKPASLADAFSLPQGYARGAQAVLGPMGDLYVVWYQDAGDGDAVYAARRGADGVWAEPGDRPVRLSSPGATGFVPRVAVGPEGGALVVWNEHVGSGPLQVVARRTGRAGDAWGPAEVLSRAGADAEHPVAAVGPGDRAVVVWAEGAAPAARIYAARVE
jgi:hypothetical protein